MRVNFGIDGGIECRSDEFDAALNATPSLSTFSAGLLKLKAGGRWCLFSGFPAHSQIPAGLINEIHYRQLQVVGAYGCTRDQMVRALKLLQRHGTALDLLIEDRIGLEQVPAVLPAVLSAEVFKYVVDF